MIKKWQIVMIKSHIDLQVWEKSMVLANLVIKAVDEIDAPCKHFRMIEQLESAVT